METEGRDPASEGGVRGEIWAEPTMTRTLAMGHGREAGKWGKVSISYFPFQEQGEHYRPHPHLEESEREEILKYKEEFRHQTKSMNHVYLAKEVTTSLSVTSLVYR